MIVVLTRSNIVQTPSHSKLSKIQWKISSREDLLLFGASGRQIKDFTELNLTTLLTGVHKSFQPSSRAGSTWSKFGARGEHGERGKDGKHGDVLRFSTEVFSGSPT